VAAKGCRAIGVEIEFLPISRKMRTGPAYAFFGEPQSVFLGIYMKHLVIIFGCGLFLLGSQAAWSEDKPQSIMFEADQEHRHLTTLPEGSGDNRRDKCAELAEQMNALKGKPQRRYAVSQQYEAECKQK